MYHNGQCSFSPSIPLWVQPMLSPFSLLYPRDNRAQTVGFVNFMEFEDSHFEGYVILWVQNLYCLFLGQYISTHTGWRRAEKHVEKVEQGWLHKLSSCLSTKRSLRCLRDKIVPLPWICMCVHVLLFVCVCKPSFGRRPNQRTTSKTTFIIVQP